MDILPVLDSFDLAFKDGNWDTADENWKKGIESIHSQLLQVLQLRGIDLVGNVGEPFDPVLHEAAGKRRKKGTDAGLVLDVVQSGYKSKDNVIRPARVVVSE